MSPRATVLIPTWDAADSLGPAIDSALAQSVEDIEVLVVSDGAKPDTLAVARDRAASDARVRVLDLEKAPARGELNRHAGVLAAAADRIVYLADDDLILPRHVELLLAALEEHDLAQSWNGYIDGQGALRLLPADLADPAWHARHLRNPPLNRVSITGTAHTVAAYRRLPHGWIVPEPGMPADLTLWRQFFALPDLRAVTLPEMTTLQFPAPDRRGFSPAEVSAQREPWEALLRRPDAQQRLQDLAAASLRREVLDLGLFASRLLEDLTVVVAQRDQLRSDLVEVAGELDARARTVSWRLTAPLRAVRARLRRAAPGS